MHSQCAAQGVRGMSGLRHLQVLCQQWAVLWIHTIVDNPKSVIRFCKCDQVIFE